MPLKQCKRKSIHLAVTNVEKWTFPHYFWNVAQVLAQCEQNVAFNREEINETGVKLEYRSLNWEEMQPSNWGMSQ